MKHAFVISTHSGTFMRELAAEFDESIVIDIPTDDLLEQLPPANISDDQLLHVVQHAVRASLFDGQSTDQIYEKGLRLVTHYLRCLTGDTVVVWGGRHLHLAAAVEAARIRGIGTVFLETGVVPTTIAIDPLGTNDRSTIARITRFPRVNMIAAQSARSRLMPQLGATVDDVPDDDALPKAFVLYLSQCHWDTQITGGAGVYPSLIAAVCAAFHAAQEQGLPLVVKVHPMDIPCGADHIRRVLPETPLLFKTPVKEAIARSQAVMTLNSGAGYEACLYDKPVVILGQALYAYCAWRPSREQSLSDTLRRAMAIGPKTQETDRFATELQYHLVSMAKPYFPRIAARIREIESGEFLQKVKERTHQSF